MTCYHEPPRPQLTVREAYEKYRQMDRLLLNPRIQCKPDVRVDLWLAIKAQAEAEIEMERHTKLPLQG